jgi:dTDP-4-amino-4,6-dideoxygalactose transaminase
MMTGGSESQKVSNIDKIVSQPLAIDGGPQAVSGAVDDLFTWPIVTDEDERAVLEVLRSGSMSGLDVARAFESEWAAYQGTEHALSFPNGTMALLTAMWAADLGRGDEIICPSTTYWASALQALHLGATPVFADIDPTTLCIDPTDIERHISPSTWAIMVVHYCGHPADMEPILALAEKHDLKVIEDVSHAHGARYNNQMVGTFGDIAAMSMMTGKSFPIGEGGMLVTDDRLVYERAVAFAHYRRHDAELTREELKKFAGYPLGAVKGRLNQTAAAMGRVQLERYPERIQDIQRALNRFWDLLRGTPGLRPHRPSPDTKSTMGGWYNPVGLYDPDALGGLSVDRFMEAVRAEGVENYSEGVNQPMHLHPVLNEADIFRDGIPTRIAFSDRDVRQEKGSLPVAETIEDRTVPVPYFKHDNADLIAQHAAAYRKVAIQAEALT